MAQKDQKLKMDIDSESLHIYRDMGEDQEPLHIVYWHADEWEADPVTVVPAMLRAIDLFHNDQVELLTVLGWSHHII